MRAAKKLNSRGGFSLAEMLMAIAILLLVSTIVAAGVPVAKDAYEKVVLSANGQTLLGTAISALQEELGTAWDVRVNDSPTATTGTFLTYYSATTGARTKLYIDAASVGQDKTVNTIFVQDNFEETALNATGLGTARSLVQDNARSGNTAMGVTFKSFAHEGGYITFNDIEVTTAGGTVIAKLPSLKIRVASEKLS